MSKAVGCCPDCGCPMVKAGMQRTNRKGDRKQQYRCTVCNRRTVKPLGVRGGT